MRRLPARYFIKETANNLWQYKTRHLFSLTIICLSFLILGVFLALSNNLGQKARELSGDLNIVFYLQKDAPDSAREALEIRLRSRPEAGEVKSIGAEEARELFLRRYPELADIVRNLKDNPFSSSVEMALSRPDIATEQILKIIEEVRTDPAVEDARFNRDWADRIRSLSRLARAAGYFLGGILILASFLIISNVIKLNVLARKSEIEILRLVGGTNAFIRMPFLLEGTVMGIAGGLVSLLLVLLVVKLFPIYLGSSLGALQELIGFRYLTFFQALALVAGGALVGFLGSLSSLARFLRV
jgi:cell division transport system permease protein